MLCIIWLALLRNCSLELDYPHSTQIHHPLL